MLEPRTKSLYELFGIKPMFVISIFIVFCRKKNGSIDFGKVSYYCRFNQLSKTKRSVWLASQKEPVFQEGQKGFVLRPNLLNYSEDPRKSMK